MTHTTFCRHLLSAVGIAVALCIAPLHAQVKQHGQVTLQNSGRKPLAGVQIRAKGAVPASSDVQGNFNLHFNKARPGQLLLLDEVYKDGYELVNEQALKQWFVSGNRPLPIVMCPKGTLAAAQAKYYDIGKQYNMERYNNVCKQLEEQLKQNKISTEKYNAELDKLSANYLQTMQQIEDYAYAMACYNRDDLNQMGAEALTLVEAGKVDEALKLYADAQLDRLYIGLDKKLEQEAQQMEAMLPSLRLNADLCLFAGGEENLQKAQDIYEAIALSDTTNATYAFEYANFLSDHRFMLKEAKSWLLLALRHTADSLQRADLYSGLGMIDTYLQGDDVQTYFEQAQSIYTALEKDTTYANDAYFNMTYGAFAINVGRFQMAQQQWDNAGSTITDHLQYAQKAFHAQPEKYCYYYAYYISELNGILHELCIANRQKTQKNLKSIIDLGDATVELLRYADRKEQTKALQLTADTYQLLSRACVNFGNTTQSEAYADSCLKVIEYGKTLNPVLFTVTKTHLLETQGNNLLARKDYQAALKCFIDAYNIAKEFSYDLKGLMQTLQSIASLALVMDDTKDALDYTALAVDYQQKYPDMLGKMQVFDIYYKYALVRSINNLDAPACEDALLTMTAWAQKHDTRREWITNNNLDDIIMPYSALYYKKKKRSGGKRKEVLNSMIDLLKLYPRLKEGKTYQYVLSELK